MRKKRVFGFTLIELIVVIIIVGILAALGFTQYTRMVERGRTAEARSVLGSLRTAQQAHFLENGTYVDDIGLLAIEAPDSCTATHYFEYSCADDGTCTADRCTAGGKDPQGSAYSIDLTIGGGWSSDPAGYV